MIEMDRINKNGYDIIFYDGIDFKYVYNYNETNISIFFIDDWNSTFLKYKRDNKINFLLGLDELNDKEICNNYVMIYQTNGYLIDVYTTIKNKFLHKE